MFFNENEKNDVNIIIPSTIGNYSAIAISTKQSSSMISKTHPDTLKEPLLINFYEEKNAGLDTNIGPISMNIEGPQLKSPLPSTAFGLTLKCPKHFSLFSNILKSKLCLYWSWDTSVLLFASVPR